MADEEHVQYFVVGVPAFGNPELEKPRVKLALARALHHMVKPGCGVAEARFNELPKEGEKVVFCTMQTGFQTLDAKGDDQGHHLPDHPVPLVDLADQ